DAFAALRDHKNDEVAEFLPYYHGQLMVRSPVLCQLILRELIPNTYVIDALIGFLRSLHAKINFSEYYRRLYHRMLTFSFVEPLFTDADKRRKLTRFFEEVRQLGYEKENPQFWMQYAIAHMSFQDYSTAETYFNTAYGLVEKKG